MANTHNAPDTFRELSAWFRSLVTGYIASGGLPTVPSSSSTLGAFATTGYVVDGGELRYVTQAAAAIVLPTTTGTYWLLLHTDVSSAVAGWTRPAGTHYLWQQSTLQPAAVAGATWLAKVTVATSIVTVIADLRRPASYLTSQIYDAEDALYGADSTGLASSTSAINTAINAARGQQGGMAKLGSGSFQLTDTLTLRGIDGGPYPANRILSLGLEGTGCHSTYLEWKGNGVWALQTVRKAMLFMGGNHVVLRNLTLRCPRNDSALNAAFASYNTPYYGIVVVGVSWKLVLENVNIEFVHVPLSMKIIKDYILDGPNGLEFEPNAGGVTLPTTDIAQLAVRNCRLQAYTHEFFDGTLNAVTQNNNNGVNLCRGRAHTTDLTSDTHSNGSYGLEIGSQQTVNVEFDSCTIENRNSNTAAGPIVNGTFRAHAVGNVIFNNCLCSAPPVNGAYNYFEFENIGSGGSNTYYKNPYLIGGLYNGNSSQGNLQVWGLDGEDNAEVLFGGDMRLISTLTGAVVGRTVFVDGISIGRGSGLKSLLLSAGVQGANPVAPFGATAAFARERRFHLDNVTGVRTLLVGHENILDMNRLQPAVNLMPDVPAILRGKAVVPTFLDASQYTPIPGAGATGFGTGFYRQGTWLLSGAAGATHVFCPMVRCDVSTCYNIAVKVYVLMVSTHLISELSGEAAIVVEFLDASGVRIGTVLQMLGSFTVTHNYDLLSDNQVVTLKQYHVIPPTGTAFIGITCTAAPNAARTQVVEFGGLVVIPAPAEVAVDALISPPLFAAAASPATGTWTTNDVVRRTPAVVGQPTGWRCTTAPGTFTAEANL